MRLVAALVAVVLVVGVVVWLSRPAANTGQVSSPAPTVAGSTSSPQAGETSTPRAEATPPPAVTPPATSIPSVAQPTVAPVPTSSSPTPVPTPVPVTPTPKAQVSFAYPVLQLGKVKFFGIEVKRLGGIISSPINGTVTDLELWNHDKWGVIPLGKTYVSLGIRGENPSSYLNFSLGELDVDVILLVKNGQKVIAGEPLFKLIGLGSSSAAFSYSDLSPFQVVGYWRSLDASNRLGESLEFSPGQIKILLEDRSP